MFPNKIVLSISLGLLCICPVQFFAAYQSDAEVFTETAIQDEKGVTLLFVPGGTIKVGATLEDASQVCISMTRTLLFTPHCESEFFEEHGFVTNAESVNVEPFYIDQTEATIGSYLVCIEQDVCSNQVAIMQQEIVASEFELDLTLPIEQISYYDAAIYCAWRQGRLPTVAEWELAARGFDQLVFPWGNEFEPENLNFRDDYYSEWNDGNQANTAPTTMFPEGKSWVGAMNMAGNISEWTSTQYTFPSFETVRIAKGGSYLSYAHEAAAWMQLPLTSNSSLLGLGFRCVRTTETLKAP